MEEKFKLTSSMEKEGLQAEVEEFYEEIEAPKFVDFTVPNHFSPDDCFWFCSRVGCNQQHMEEMDSEAIYKNFVLRVMAARSPNVRFRRALNRKPPSDSKKCPFSAPPKSSKTRLQRLGLVSCSISKRLNYEENGKLKVVPSANVKPGPTPKARVKNVAAKYMTSPRKKMGSSPKLNAFRSVRNPNKTRVSLPKSKVVAKAMVFSSPKKALKKKESEEFTPITKLCEGVKKLEINSQKKGIVTRTLAKECTSEKKLPLDRSRKILGSSKAKARVVDSRLPISAVKSKAKTSKRKHGDAAQFEAEKGGNESSDMEIDEKSRCGSLELGSATVKPRATDQSSSQEERTSTSDRPMTGESSGAVSLNSQKSDMHSGPDSDDKVSAEENTEAIQAPNVDEQSQEKDNTVTDDLENQNPVVVSKLEDNNDKENALTSANISDENFRNLNGNDLSKHETPVKPKIKTKQNPQKLDKTSKENCPAGTGGTEGLKNKKLKPTNPKPFRLRTDERGILKEATLERKANSHENSSTTSENTQGMGNGVSDNKEKGGKKDEGKLKPIKSRYKTLKGVEPKSENSSGIAKSPFLQKQVGSQREIGSHVKYQGRGAIEKTKIMSRPNESRKQGKEVDDPTEKASEAKKSASKGKRPATIPREPNFHSLHKPKGCTRNK